MQKTLDDSAARLAAASRPSAASAYALADPTRFAQNMVRVGMQSQKLMADFVKRRAARTGSEPLDPLNLAGTFSALLRAMAENPGQIVEAQFALWRDFMGLWESSASRMLGGKSAPVVAPGAGDKRFRDKEWSENQLFDFVKQSYLLTANWIQDTVGKVELEDPDAKKRVRFYTKQFVDAIAPTNFLLTNPEVLRATIQSNGDNLVKGLDNLLEDIERGDGQLAIRQTADSFTPGENIAITPGKVIFRNELLELLQYAPTTAEVYERPLLIFPPWINKFYILDLRPENSFIKWLVSRGYTVFVAS
ncbi:MAG: class I poly(R)-hydroxyalkanoic acid synthase, partial [Alphaproteobacteria bacterium]|nr:class I poly(R)-hydroxyalkanoic acid synthase [Alphaproteobacteria bacterium]